MNRIFTLLARTVLSGFGCALLIGTAIFMAAIGIGLTAMMVIKYAEETPELITLECAIGIERPDCVDYQKQLDDLEAERAALARQLEALKRQFAHLEAIADKVDVITLFETYALDHGRYRLHVGSRYNAITEGNNGFESYYCYVDIGLNDSGLTRHLYIRNGGTNVEFTPTQIREAGINEAILKEARTLCLPLLIGG